VYQQQEQQQQEQQQQEQEQQDAENPFLDPPFSRIKKRSHLVYELQISLFSKEYLFSSSSFSFSVSEFSASIFRPKNISKI
jgi:hypothetical protein